MFDLRYANNLVLHCFSFIFHGNFWQEFFPILFAFWLLTMINGADCIVHTSVSIGIITLPFRIMNSPF